MSYKLIVENYGKIEKVELEVAPLTLFVGDNNSGKSYLLSLIWALFSGEENNILYRGIDELLEKKFSKLYSEFMGMLADDEVTGKYIVIDEQKLLQIMNELLMMNKDDFVRSIFNYEGMKKETSALKNLNISYPSLNAYINMVLYTNYISKFDTRFFNGELKNSRLWIMHGERRNIIVISSKQNTQYEFHFLDSQGNIIEDLCEDEIREIQRKNIVVWSN